jgi:hypothetical protein
VSEIRASFANNRNVINKTTGFAGERYRRALFAEDGNFINYLAYLGGGGGLVETSHLLVQNEAELLPRVQAQAVEIMSIMFTVSYNFPAASQLPASGDTSLQPQFYMC